MISSSPPPYTSVEDVNDVTLKDATLVPGKGAQAHSPLNQAAPVPTKETAPLNTVTVPNTPIPYSTAPSTPLPFQQQQQQQHQQQHQHQQQAIPLPTHAVYLPGTSGQVGAAPYMGTPPLACGAAATTVPGVPTYPNPIAVHPMYGQLPAVGMNPPVGGMGTNPNQNGAINLVVNTNANSNTNSNTAGAGNGASARPAPRPCPKCRLGYITRGQARCREMFIKALAYSTICCTCLIPLQLLKTNYVDKCSYCGEEYGFRGELFEKPKPVKV